MKDKFTYDDAELDLTSKEAAEENKADVSKYWREIPVSKSKPAAPHVEEDWRDPNLATKEDYETGISSYFNSHKDESGLKDMFKDLFKKSSDDKESSRHK